MLSKRAYTQNPVPSAYTPNEASFKFDDEILESNTLDRIKKSGKEVFDPGGLPKTPFNTNKPKKPELDLEAELREELLSVPKFEKIRSKSQIDDFDLTENPFDIIKPAKRELPKRPDLVEVTKSLEAISEDRLDKVDSNFKDIGQTLIIRDRPDDHFRKKTLLWSNPSPFGQSDKPKVIRHVEAPKPKGYSLAPLQKFQPAGNFSVNHTQ